ncbi:hypothetical protein T12_14241 [Trichinella patagoniensis]|uniref:Uncharacterized protein n=1 Tax=Trichinella patagoniensis TaxID=990121 RepID=A0A0V0ZKG4_9BILA|nr:hypothetical protein T12_14241 [Trichinella patagoniensis]
MVATPSNVGCCSVFVLPMKFPANQYVPYLDCPYTDATTLHGNIGIARRILADSADMTTYCRKSPAAETKAGFVDALVRILMHYEKEILAFRLHVYLVTYPVISPHPSSQCRDHRISLILAEEACTPPAQRANEKLTLPRVYEKGASHYWVQPFLVSPSSTCFKYFRCYTRLVAISQSSFTPDGVPIVCPLDYGLLFLIGCSLIGYTEFER